MSRFFSGCFGVLLASACGGSASEPRAPTEKATVRAAPRIVAEVTIRPAFIEEETLAPLGKAGLVAVANRIGEPIYEGEVYVLVVGPAAPDNELPPLLLVHGLGEKAGRDFDPILASLAAKRTVIVVDLPGFGVSTHASKPYSPRGQARVLDHVLTVLRQGRVDVLGHSMGGAIALEFAARFHDRVRRLVLVDAAGILHREAFVMGHVRRVGDSAFDLLPGKPSLALPMIAAGELLRGLEPRTESWLESEEFRRYALSSDPGSISAFSLSMTDFSARVGRVEAATSIVWGRRDLVAPLRTGKALRSRIANSELHLLQTGHDPMSEAPLELVGLIEAHLAPGGLKRIESPKSSDAIDAHYENTDRLSLSGHFRSLTLRNCKDTFLADALVGKLVFDDVSGTLENVVVTQGSEFRDTRLVVTGGTFSGAPPFIVEDTDLDIAGASLESESEHLFATRDEARVVFSISLGKTKFLAPSNLHGVLALDDEAWPARAELPTKRVRP